MKRFIIIGLGNFGSGVAEALHALGHDVVALDINGDRVDRIAPHVTRAAVGDGKDIRTLERVGARDADAAVISTGDDITASVLATLALRDVGVETICVKVISADHARVMDKIGATETVFPERESAIRLGHRIASRTLLNYVALGEGFSMQEMAVPDRWIGKSLRDLKLPRAWGVSVIAVHDVLTGEIRPVPDPDAPLKESDTLLVAGLDRNLEKCAKVR
jgi:trk system potassium uptake protein TrkA